MKTILVLFIMLVSVCAEPSTPKPRRPGETWTDVERDAGGKIVATYGWVAYPTGYSVTVRDASGKLVRTMFLAHPTLR